MTQTHTRLCLALNALNSLISPRRAHQTIAACGSIEAVFQADIPTLINSGLSELAARALSAPDWSYVDSAQAWADRPGRYILTLTDPRYPSLLRELADPPLVLFCEGDVTLLAQTCLAIVGSRSPTPIGVETAQAFAAQLARLGFVIVSGMALGIDGAAHRGALACAGKTIAIVGTGPDKVYPARHAALAQEIVRQGLLVSEFPLGSLPLPRHFPQRNRIISGLSRGVLVVEAGINSGSLITARMALDQGREVFAVPGSIHNPNSKGCHLLLRDGAKLVQSIDDILEEFDTRYVRSDRLPAANEAEETTPLDAASQQLLAAIDAAPTSVETIIERSGLTPDAVCSMLLVLEMRKFVHMTATGQYCRAAEGSGNERKHTRCLDVSL